MAITKQGYDSSKTTASTKAKVDLDLDGNILIGTGTVGGSKYLSFKGVNEDNGLNQNALVMNAFLNHFFDANVNDQTNQMQITWFAEES